MTTFPRDVCVDEHFTFSFGKCEMENAARMLVAMLRRDNLWRPFTCRELADFAAGLSDTDRQVLGLQNATHTVVTYIHEDGGRTTMSFEESWAYDVAYLIAYGWVEGGTDVDSELRVTDAFIERLTQGRPR